MKKVMNELWVLNLGGKDVSISDLGVKVPAGKAVNVYKVNPYLTTYQVKESLENGVLASKITLGRLKVVTRKPANPVPPDLNRIRESDQTVVAKKTKSSVVIDSETETLGEDGAFDFADYGVTDLGPVTQNRQDDGTVVVNTKQDEVETHVDSVKLEPTLEAGPSEQSQIVMKQTKESMIDPTGPIADASFPTEEKPFTVVKPPVAEKEELVKTTTTGKVVSKDETGTIVVDGEKKFRSIKQIKNAQDEGISTEDAADDSAIVMEKTAFDSKAATQTEDGAIVMKIKEEEPAKPESKVVEKKPRPSKEK